MLTLVTTTTNSQMTIKFYYTIFYLIINFLLRTIQILITNIQSTPGSIAHCIPAPLFPPRHDIFWHEPLSPPLADTAIAIASLPLVILLHQEIVPTDPSPQNHNSLHLQYNPCTSDHTGYQSVLAGLPSPTSIVDCFHCQSLSSLRHLLETKPISNQRQ